jgi:hypothetical protein
MIAAGQIYTRHDPVENVTYRVRVIRGPINGYGGGKAWVESLLPDGRAVRQRPIEASQLHDSPTTRAGQPRRTGYVLEAEPSR